MSIRSSHLEFVVGTRPALKARTAGSPKSSGVTHSSTPQHFLHLSGIVTGFLVNKNPFSEKLFPFYLGRSCFVVHSTHVSYDGMTKPGMALSKSTCESFTRILRDHLVMCHREDVPSSRYLCAMLTQKFDSIESCSLLAFDDVQT